jgi:hypothetical protein
MPDTRPVSDLLAAELSAELSRRGLVIWLDRDRHYTGFVDELVSRHQAGQLDYPVVAFNGSFLEIMLALVGVEDGLDPSPLLIHMPGFNEDMMRATPLLELYKAGFRYRRALDTLIREAATGVVPPEEIEDHLAASPTLEEAEAWLAARARGERSGLEELLDRTSIETVVRELLIEDTFLGDALDPERAEDLPVLRGYLHRQLGMSEAWLSFVGASDSRSRPLGLLTDALAAWLLCVEYVDDLLRPPVLPELQPLEALPRKIIDLCRKCAAALRKEHPDSYEIIADNAEPMLERELAQVQAADLGRIDTFRGEEAIILDAAVQSLASGDWSSARELAGVRRAERSFWLEHDRHRRIVWELVAGAAAFGCQIAANARPFADVTSHEQATSRYTDEAFKVDREHRRFEQLQNDRLRVHLPHFARLTGVVGELRKRYREWADRLAIDFSDLCRKHGLLPEQSLQQRHIFTQVVQPMLRGSDKVAIFLVDALRYEMATELIDDLAGSGIRPRLSARYAELPTITPVGMNALAPVAQGDRLVLAGKRGFKGFSTGEFVVDDPADRARAMGQRSLGEQALALTMAEINLLDAATLKRRVAQKQLIVVHDREIDEAGEAGVGLNTFEHTIGQIKAAWLHLEKAGVKQLVVTSDHGFLLLDETAAERTYGKRTDPWRRYALADERRQEQGLLTASLSELGYGGRDGYLLLNQDTALFATRKGSETFAHGGNSPQERFIPVLTLTSKRAVDADLYAYTVEATAESDALDCHRVRLRLVHDTARSAALPFPLSTTIDLALDVPGRQDIRVVVVEVTGPYNELRGRIQAPVVDEWSEVFFRLEGPVDEQVQLQVHHPDAIEDVAPCLVKGWFSVLGSTAEEPEQAAGTPAADDEWLAGLPDDGTRRIFSHLARHGSITESEATGMLGTPRRFRKFSRSFEELCALTPLRVRIESTPDGKRYVKEGETSS